MFKKFQQYFCNHTWTSKASEGIPPPEGIKDIFGFYEYATLYCSKCGKVSELSKETLKRISTNGK